MSIWYCRVTRKWYYEKNEVLCKINMITFYADVLYFLFTVYSLMKAIYLSYRQRYTSSTKPDMRKFSLTWPITSHAKWIFFYFILYFPIFISENNCQKVFHLIFCGVYTVLCQENLFYFQHLISHLCYHFMFHR